MPTGFGPYLCLLCTLGIVTNQVEHTHNNIAIITEETTTSTTTTKPLALRSATDQGEAALRGGPRRLVDEGLREREGISAATSWAVSATRKPTTPRQVIATAKKAYVHRAINRLLRHCNDLPCPAPGPLLQGRKSSRPLRREVSSTLDGDNLYTFEEE